MSGEGDESSGTILRHLGDHDLRSAWEEFLAKCDDVDLGELLDQVDESSYSLADWVEALLAFDGWLEEQNVAVRPLRAMVGYVHCATLNSAKGVSLASLKVNVYQLLTEFGFSHIDDPQI